MFCEEIFPSSFRDTVLHMVFKAGKMSKGEVLPDNRFIQSKQAFLPRLAESLLVEQGVKQPLLLNSTRYQIGGQPGHRPVLHEKRCRQADAGGQVDGRAGSRRDQIL